MKKTFQYIFLGACALFFVACSRKEGEEKRDIPVVYVSILPEAGLVRTIAGRVLEVRVLVKKNQSPHHYEPTARELTRLSDAHLLLALGFPFEQQIIKKMKPLYPQLQVVDISKGIVRRTVQDDLHHHAETDPHIWFAPKNLSVLASNICDALSKTYPAHAEIFQGNLKKLQQQIQQLDAQIKMDLAPFKGRAFYVFHPSFGYFSDAYALKQVAVEQDGKAPTPRELARLIRNAKTEGTQVVLVQKSFPPKSAEAVANAIHGRVVVLNPLAENPLETIQKLANVLTDSWKETTP